MIPDFPHNIWIRLAWLNFFCRFLTLLSCCPVGSLSLAFLNWDSQQGRDRATSGRNNFFYSYPKGKVWCHWIWIQTYFGFIVLILPLSRSSCPTQHTTNNLIVAERDHVQTHLCAVSSPTPSLDSTIEQKLLLANNGIEDCQIFIVVGSILGCLLIAASLLMCLLSVRLFKLTKSTSTSHIFTNPEFSICIFFETKASFQWK